ncbi:MAG: adenylate/guanylate cyclase domain-containing protein [Rhodospirillaceae bacterium]|nr:adenylate/guanylate cyclase domain-containing protein [Rhodospirillaceae bacterium]
MKPSILGLLALALLLMVRALDPVLLGDLRSLVFDTYQRLAPRPYQFAPVRVVDIDDRSLAAYGQWPWPRDLLAEVVGRLGDAGAAVVALDIILAEPDRTSPARIVDGWRADPRLAPLADLVEAEAGIPLPDNDATLATVITQVPTVTAFALTRVGSDAVPRLVAGLANAGSPPERYLESFPGAVVSLPALEAAAWGNGSVGIGGGGNELIRRVPMLQRLRDQIYPTLPMEALRVAQGASTLITRAADASGEIVIGDYGGLTALRNGAFDIPLTADGYLWLHYTGTVPERTIPAASVLDGTADLATLVGGNIVFIGSSAAGLSDLRATPINDFEPGVLIHAQAIEQILLGWFLERPDWATGAEILALLALGVLMIVLLPRVGALFGAVAGLLLVTAAAAGSWLAFSEARLLLDPVYAIIGGSAVYLVVSAAMHVRTEHERGFVRQAFTQYLSPALVGRLLEHPERLKLGGETRELTFLFSDIAGFTSFTERADPEVLVALLNEYLDGMCAIVMAHGGTIDKIVGDAVHAMFNAPVDQPDHADRAVDCALALDGFAEAFRARKAAEGLPFGLTRIGVNTGEVVVGNFGGSRRFDYTAHGDAINTTARIESVNKHLGTRVCVTGETKRVCRKAHRYRPVGALLLKGKAKPVKAFEPLDGGDQDETLLAGYRALYQAMAEGRDDAPVMAEALANSYPDDPLIALHARRLARGERGIEIVFDEK